MLKMEHHSEVCPEGVQEMMTCLRPWQEPVSVCMIKAEGSTVKGIGANISFSVLEKEMETSR